MFPGKRAQEFTPGTSIRYTPAERIEQLRLIEQLMVNAVTLHATRLAMRGRWPHFSQRRVEVMRAAIADRWEAEARERGRSEKEAAVRRVVGHLQKAIRDGDRKSIHWAEAHLAKMCGHFAPERVELTERSQTLADAVRFLTPRQIEEMREAYKRKVELAEKAEKAGLGA